MIAALCFVIAASLTVATGLMGTVTPAEAIETGQPLRAALTKPFKGDFDQMVERRRVRVLIPLGRAYFQIRGRQIDGVAARQLRVLERQINRDIHDRSKRIFVFAIPTPRDRLIPDLVAGRGDIALGNLTVTPERNALVDFSQPLLSDVKEIVVTSREVADLRDPSDLSGMTVTVRRSSSFHEHLVALNRELEAGGRSPIDVRAADERLETEDLVEMVHAGLIEATVTDDHVIDLWEKVFTGIKAHRAAPVHTGGQVALAFRKNSPKLAERVNTFVSTARRGTEHGNILLREFARNDRWLKNIPSNENRRLHPEYERFFATYGKRYNIDPHLIAAVAFQESNFNAKLVMRRSGATGLMQMMPATARLPIVGISNLLNPEDNVHAFTKYFRHLRDAYVDQPNMADVDRLMLTLASYNAGPTKIARLRRQSETPNVWFENVEWTVWRVVGAETVDYVRNVYRYYVWFKGMSEGPKRQTDTHPGEVRWTQK